MGRDFLKEVSDTDEFDGHRARFARKTLREYRGMKAYVAFKIWHHQAMKERDEKARKDADSST